MKHDILGEITQTDEDVFDGVAKVQYGSHDIKIQMSCDDQLFEAVLDFAAEIVRQIAKLDAQAKQIAVAGLRETYNGGWNEYDEAQADGSFKTVINPQLSEAEFEAILTLNAINVTGHQMIDFFYDDSGMFWGHSVVVNSLNGTDLRDARAELFG